MKRLALLLHHGGTAPDLIYPSLEKLDNIDIVTFYIKSDNNASLNKVYDQVIGTIGPAQECYNESDMLEKVTNYHSKYPIDGVLTFAEMLLEIVSKISKLIGQKYPSTNDIYNLQNKIRQREILANNDVPVPKFYEIKNKEDLSKAIQYIGFPSVLKPNYGGGGYGIFFVENSEDLRESYNSIIQNYENIILDNVKSTFTLEEYMVGEKWNENDLITDYCSVETIVENNEMHHVGISDRTALVAPFRESGYITPSSLDIEKQNEILKIVEKALKALNINNMMTHTEVKFTGNGPKIIEVNGRPGGTVPFRIQNATNGEYDLFIELANLALGNKIKTNINYQKYAASKVSHGIKGKHKIKSIDFSKVENISSLTLMIPIKGVGDYVDSFKGIEDILGLYYLENPNLNNLLNAMNEIDELLEVEYE